MQQVSPLCWAVCKEKPDEINDQPAHRTVNLHMIGRFWRVFVHQQVYVQFVCYYTALVWS